MIKKSQWWLKKQKKSMTSWKKLTLTNILKRYPLNILKRSQWSYLITEQKLNENKITL
jgi:hypothetical protein